MEFAIQGFISIWPLYPEDQFNYYGPGNHEFSERITFINTPLKPTEKQLRRLRELVSVLAYNRIVEKIYTSRVNERGRQYNFGYYGIREENDKKDLLHSIDREIQFNMTGR